MIHPGHIALGTKGEPLDFDKLEAALGLPLSDELRARVAEIVDRYRYFTTPDAGPSAFKKSLRHIHKALKGLVDAREILTQALAGDPQKDTDAAALLALLPGALQRVARAEALEDVLAHINQPWLATMRDQAAALAAAIKTPHKIGTPDRWQRRLLIAGLFGVYQAAGGVDLGCRKLGGLGHTGPFHAFTCEVIRQADGAAAAPAPEGIGRAITDLSHVLCPDDPAP